MITNEDKLILVHLILRTEMYTRTADENSIVGFIEGFSMSRKGDFDFKVQISNYLESKFKIESSSDGWSGQLKRYANKKSISWVIAFKQVGLTVLAAAENGELTLQMKEAIKEVVIFLINAIYAGNPFFNDNWISKFSALCSGSNNWFKDLWSREEYQSIQNIITLINRGECFETSNPNEPTEVLLTQKEKFISSNL